MQNKGESFPASNEGEGLTKTKESRGRRCKFARQTKGVCCKKQETVAVLGSLKNSQRQWQRERCVEQWLTLRAVAVHVRYK